MGAAALCWLLGRQGEGGSLFVLGRQGEGQRGAAALCW